MNLLRILFFVIFIFCFLPLIQTDNVIDVQIGGNVFAASPKYIVVHAWNPGPDDPYYFTGCSTAWMKPMLDVIGKKGDGNIRLGFADVIYALNTDDVKIESCLDDFFNSAEQYDVPFLLHIDTERFWDSRPDLWNWFDPSRPGYNPANKDNVEWSDWNTPTKESFINWGSPMQLSPKPCYESQAVRQVIEDKFGIIANKVNAWRQKLASESKNYLFIGVDIAMETGIDDYRNASWVPTQDKYQLGYNALSKRGFNTANLPADINAELEKTVADFNQFRAKFFYDQGIPKDKIYTHVWAADDQDLPGIGGYDQHSPIATGQNGYSTLGITLYPPAYDASRVKAAIGAAPWALIESPPSVITAAPANYLSVKDWLNFGNCRLAMVNGLSVSRADTIPHIQELASLIPACTPKTCAALGDYSCGKWSDGCGGTLNCGTCGVGKACSTGTCASTCAPKTCASLGCVCGNQSDGCGNTLNCGACDSGKTCSNGNCIATAVNLPAVNITANSVTNTNTVTQKPVTQMSRSEILAAIAQIQALIADLQKQLAAITGSTTTYSCSQITKNLFYGLASDPQVKCLQEVLKSQGYAVTASGNYDAATKTAVAQFQQKYASEILATSGLKYGSGNVGNATRAKINQIVDGK